MFQLTKDEWENLTFQIGISNKQHGGRRFMPYVQLRHYVLTKPDTNAQIAELRKLLMLYIEKNDKRVNDIIIALNNLIGQPKQVKQIGFNTD